MEGPSVTNAANPRTYTLLRLPFMSRLPISLPFWDKQSLQLQLITFIHRLNQNLTLFSIIWLTNVQLTSHSIASVGTSCQWWRGRSRLYRDTYLVPNEKPGLVILTSSLNSRQERWGGPQDLEVHLRKHNLFPHTSATICVVCAACRWRRVEINGRHFAQPCVPVGVFLHSAGGRPLPCNPGTLACGECLSSWPVAFSNYTQGEHNFVWGIYLHIWSHDRHIFHSCQVCMYFIQFYTVIKLTSFKWQAGEKIMWMFLINWKIILTRTLWERRPPPCPTTPPI